MRVVSFKCGSVIGKSRAHALSVAWPCSFIELDRDEITLQGGVIYKIPIDRIEGIKLVRTIPFGFPGWQIVHRIESIPPYVFFAVPFWKEKELRKHLKDFGLL